MFKEINESSGTISYENININDNSNNINQGYNGCCQSVMPSICEAPREKVCHRYCCYDVPHIVPCNTRIINHHVYKHSYVPEYTCCEENEYQNIYEGCQNNFF